MKLDFSFDHSRCQSEQSEIALASLRTGCEARLVCARDHWQKRYEFARKQYLDVKRKEEEALRRQVEEEERLRKREEERLKVEQERLRREEADRMCQDDARLREIEVRTREEAQTRREAKERIADDAEARRLERINAKRQPEEKTRAGEAKRQPEEKTRAGDAKRQPEEKTRAGEAKRQPEDMTRASEAKRQPEEKTRAGEAKRQPEEKTLAGEAKRRALRSTKNTVVRLEAKEKENDKEVQRLERIEAKRCADAEARAAADHVCCEEPVATFEGCSMSVVQQTALPEVEQCVLPSQKKKRRDGYGYGGNPVENPKRRRKDENGSANISKDKRKSLSATLGGRKDVKKSKNGHEPPYKGHELKSDHKMGKKSSSVSWTEPISVDYKNMNKNVRFSGVENDERHVEHSAKYKATAAVTHDDRKLDSVHVSRSKRTAGSSNPGLLDGMPSVGNMEKNRKKHLSSKDKKLSRSSHGTESTHVERGKRLSSSAIFNRADDNTRAAPLVRAALSAASQETDRASQASTKMRSMHKQTPKSTKKLDVFATNDVGFLDESLSFANEKHAVSRKTRGHTTKSILVPKRAPLSTNESKRESQGDREKMKSSGLPDKVSAHSSLHPTPASGMPSIEEKGLASSKNNSNARVRRKKSACKITTYQSFDDDFSFM